MKQADYTRIRAAEKLKHLIGLPEAVITFTGDDAENALQIHIQGYPDFINSDPGGVLSQIVHATVTSQRGSNNLVFTVGEGDGVSADRLLQRIADFNFGAPSSAAIH